MQEPPIPSSHDLSGAHPTGNDFNWLAKRQVGNAITLAAERYASGRLLDIGCGEKPYARVFAPFVSEYVGVDHAESPHSLASVDVIASAESIPLASAAFETVLMSELLEHVEEPRAALAEAYRLLSPGGHVIITTPFIWVIHEEPRDFWRASPYALRWLLSEAGFEVTQIVAVGGQWSTIGLLLSYAITHSPLRRLPLIARLLAQASQHVGYRLDRVNWQPWMAWNHLAVGRKPVG